MSDAMFWGLVDMFCRLRDGKEDMEMAAMMGEPITPTTECKHPNTAPDLERASVWCPDCKKWVVLAKELQERSKRDDAVIVGSEIRAALYEQRQEIERLTKSVSRRIVIFVNLLRRNGELESEIERLQARNEVLQARNEVLERVLVRIRDYDICADGIPEDMKYVQASMFHEFRRWAIAAAQED